MKVCLHPNLQVSMGDHLAGFCRSKEEVLSLLNALPSALQPSRAAPQASTEVTGADAEADMEVKAEADSEADSEADGEAEGPLQLPAITATFAAEAAAALLEPKAAISKLIIRLLKRGPLSLQVPTDLRSLELTVQ